MTAPPGGIGSSIRQLLSGGMRELTIASYYGKKPHRLVSLIHALQSAISRELGREFAPRTVHDIHATLVGVGRIDHFTGPPTVSPMIWPHSQHHVDLVGLFHYLCSAAKGNGFSIQFGGFEDRDYKLSSRGQRLYNRSFVSSNGDLVLIGWPVRTSDGNPEPSTTVDQIRRDCARFGVIHKYHESPTAVDPDLYLVLGRWTGGKSQQAPNLLAGLETLIRKFLSRNQTTVRLTTSHLQAVAYVDRTLPRESSLAAPLCTLLSPDELDRFLRGT